MSIYLSIRLSISVYPAVSVSPVYLSDHYLISLCLAMLSLFVFFVSLSAYLLGYLFCLSCINSSSICLSVCLSDLCLPSYLPMGCGPHTVPPRPPSLNLKCSNDVHSTDYQRWRRMDRHTSTEICALGAFFLCTGYHDGLDVLCGLLWVYFIQ